MNKLYLLGASMVSGVVLASAIATPVAAWHPKGQIKKSVQNQTANSALSDANDAKTAVSSKPGDVLKYVIEVSNTGSADNNGYNDMYKTVLKDTLPVGVELVSNPAQRDITENLGVLKPGQKVTKEYLVKVTSKQDKAVITNKACFTGDSQVNDAPQSGCDPAVVTVTVPPVPPTTPPKTPELPRGEGGPAVDTKAAVTELPKTGPASVAGIFTSISGLGYAVHRVATRKRQ